MLVLSAITTVKKHALIVASLFFGSLFIYFFCLKHTFYWESCHHGGVFDAHIDIVVFKGIFWRFKKLVDTVSTLHFKCSTYVI